MGKYSKSKNLTIIEDEKNLSIEGSVDATTFDGEPQSCRISVKGSGWLVRDTLENIIAVLRSNAG